MNTNSIRVASVVSSRRLIACAAALFAALAIAAPEVYAQGNKPKPNQTFNMIPITVTSVTPQNGQLVANGVVGSTPFQVPLTLTAGAIPAGGTCPVLHLELGPIHLSLLGLNVDTSAICLDITAQSGGGLLGDLLCQIGNLLNQGNSISLILSNLTAAQLSTLDSGLTTVLNQVVFTPLTSSSAVSGASCSILNLSLGPVTLDLLGLTVHLDNCNNGPVTVKITATPSGGLLGELLCDLADLLKGHASSTAILTTLQQIAAAISQLLG